MLQDDMRLFFLCKLLSSHDLTTAALSISLSHIPSSILIYLYKAMIFI